MMFDPCKAALPAIEAGTELALAVADGRRSRSLPDVPTFDEAGIHGVELRIWTGVLAPRGTPPEVVAVVNRAIREALATPDLTKAMADQGSDAGQTSPEAFSTFVEAERSRWRTLATETGVRGVSRPL
jgi:tripartite-type tricarboxylate transporter receptor subunit TctC